MVLAAVDTSCSAKRGGGNVVIFSAVRNISLCVLAALVALLAIIGFHGMIFVAADHREILWRYAEFLFLFSLIVYSALVVLVLWKKKRSKWVGGILIALFCSLAAPPAQIGFVFWVGNKPIWIAQFIAFAFVIYALIMLMPLRWWKVWYQRIRR